MATIYDVAHAAGVSKSTVSRVLAQNGYVKAATRKRILAAIRELHYVPSQRARSFSARQARSVAVLVRRYFPLVGEFLNHMDMAAATADLSLTLYFTGTPANELAIINRVIASGVDAIFILTRANTWARLQPYAEFVPMAAWERVEEGPITSVFVDHQPIYRALLETFYAAGHRCIGNVLSSLINQNTPARIRAITDFHAAHPDTIVTWCPHYDQQQGSGAAAWDTWQTLTPQPTAIAMFSDYTAAEFAANRPAASPAPPCAIVGSDNTDIGLLTGISTIDFNLPQQAANAVAILRAKLTGTEPQVTPIEPRFIWRRSFAPTDMPN